MGIYLGSNQIDNINIISTSRLNTDIEDQIIQRTISQYSNNMILNIRNCAFYGCVSLASVSLPQATTIGTNAFANCYSLASINSPQVTSIGAGAFTQCYALISVNLPQVTSIGYYAFFSCYSLTSISLPQTVFIAYSAFEQCKSLPSISLPQISYIGSYAFNSCYNLISLYLLGSSIPTLANISAFKSTPISNYTTSTGGVYGSIFVPASLYSSYLTAKNWSTYSARIVSV